MRSLLGIVALVSIGLVVSLSALGADDKDKKSDAKKPDVKKSDAKKDKDADKDKDKDKEKPTEKWIKFGTVTGKIEGVVEAKKSLRIELTVNNKKVPVEWQSTDDVKVRFGNERVLPPHFDDKGRIKRYTAKELRELKGEDKKTPGYPADFSDLKPGQYVQVMLVKKKGAPRTTGKRSKDADPSLLGDNLPHMSMIIIVVAAAPN